MQWYDRFHHVLLHGLPGALLCTLLFVCFAREKVKAAVWIFLCYHLHLACDLLGSRGGTEKAIWPIHYLAPFSESMTFAWSGQWPLTSWQNTTLTVALMVYAIALAVRRGYSPVGLFSPRADAVVVETLRRRFSRP